jgi:hypothetical protein
MNEDKKRSKEDEMSFSDSWKRTSVEMAIGGAIIAGAADTIIKGNPTAFVNGGKDAIKAIGGGLNRYIGKKGTPGQKFMKNVGMKTVKNLRNEADTMERTLDDFAKSEFGTISKKYQSTLDNPVIKKRVEDEAVRNLRSRGIEVPTQDQLDIEMERVRTKRSESTSNKNKEKKTGRFEAAKANFSASAITGLGLGAGVTAFHSLERALNPNERNKSKETSYEIAGSFLGKGNGNMKKTAGVREVYDGLAGVAGNAPKAVATGLGYTGVSLGTAKLLNDQQKKKEEKVEPAKNNSRIIIELGHEAQDDNASHATRNTSLSMLPKYKDLQKTAGAGSFLKNLGGRGGEVTNLERRISGQTVNYRDEAANSLKGKNINEMADKKYGNLIHKSQNDMPYHGGQDFFKRELLDSEANLLKRNDQAKLEQIKDEVATARMKGIGSLAGLGTTGTLIGSMGKDDKKDA